MRSSAFLHRAAPNIDGACCPLYEEAVSIDKLRGSAFILPP